jgi:hypothetical protein
MRLRDGRPIRETRGGGGTNYEASAISIVIGKKEHQTLSVPLRLPFPGVFHWGGDLQLAGADPLRSIAPARWGRALYPG